MFWCEVLKQLYLSCFKTLNNKGSQPKSVVWNLIHAGGWFQQSHKGKVFKDAYICLAWNRVLLYDTVIQPHNKFTYCAFTRGLISLIGILLMFVLVSCNENCVFWTMNKSIVVALQWLNQESMGSTSEWEFTWHTCCLLNIVFVQCRKELQLEKYMTCYIGRAKPIIHIDKG